MPVFTSSLLWHSFIFTAFKSFGNLVSPNINQIAQTTCKVSNTSVAVPDFFSKKNHPKRFLKKHFPHRKVYDSFFSIWNPSLCGCIHQIHRMSTSGPAFQRRGEAWLLMEPSPSDQRFWGENFPMWVFPKIAVPQKGWFIMENPIIMDDLGGTTIFGNIHVYLILLVFIWAMFWNQAFGCAMLLSLDLIVTLCISVYLKV